MSLQELWTHLLEVTGVDVDEQQQGEILTSEICVSVRHSGESCNGR
jgi:hypothetical protein